ncbi:MAG: DUF427 domain-containing protein [Myxococcota bacterium]
MAKATWNGVVVAESDHTEMVEGNHYFPRESIKSEYFESTSHSTVCPWKGTASYFTLKVDGETNENAAWTYESPKSAAANIKDHVAFYLAKGVEVSA